jgi:hypothetical protein
MPTVLGPRYVQPAALAVQLGNRRDGLLGVVEDRLVEHFLPTLTGRAAGEHVGAHLHHHLAAALALLAGHTDDQDLGLLDSD